MKQASVVGGTGMLSDVALWLIQEGYHVFVIGRNTQKMDILMNKVKENHY